MGHGYVAYGLPHAKACRWCKAGKTLHRGVLLCPVCDHPAERIAPDTTATTETD